MKRSRYGVLGFLALVLSLPCLGAASAAPAASNSYFKLIGNSASNSQGLAVEQTSDGGYAMVGTTDAPSDSTLVVKVNAAGGITWQNSYVVAGWFGYSAAIHQTSSGYIVAIDVGGLPDKIAVFALDNAGNPLWQTSYVTALNQGMAYLHIEPTTDGGYLLGLEDVQVFSGSSAAAWALKLDAKGNVLWQEAFDFASSSIHATSDGGAIIVGAMGGCAWSCAGVGYAVKLDASGNATWQKEYQHGDGGFGLNSGRQLPDGSYLVSGTYYAGTDEEALLMKLSATGDVSWQQGYSSNACSDLGIAAIDAQPVRGGGYDLMLTGGCFLANELVARLDNKRAVVWQEGFYSASGKPPIWTNALNATRDGGLVGIGYVGSGLGYPAHVVLSKLNSQGGTVSTCTNLQLVSPGIAPVASATVVASDTVIASINTSLSAATTSMAASPAQLQTQNGCQK